MYELRQTGTSLEEIQRYSDLLSSVFSNTHHLSLDYLNWQYALNPAGSVVGFDAWAGDELAAHYVTIPVRFTIVGRATNGLLSLNTATHPTHQGKGLFTALASKTYELAETLGYEFVIGVANQNSTPGFLKKLGFYLIGPLDVKVGVGWVGSKRQGPYALNPLWDEERLRWRLSNPSRIYRSKHGNVYASTGKFGINAVLGLDKSLPDQTSPLSVVGIQTWIGIDTNITFRGLFVDLPNRLRTSPLNCIFKDINGSFPVFTKGDVHLELIDFDAY